MLRFFRKPPPPPVKKVTLMLQPGTSFKIKDGEEITIPQRVHSVKNNAQIPVSIHVDSGVLSLKLHENQDKAVGRIRIKSAILTRAEFAK